MDIQRSEPSGIIMVSGFGRGTRSKDYSTNSISEYTALMLAEMIENGEYPSRRGMSVDHVIPGRRKQHHSGQGVE